MSGTSLDAIDAAVVEFDTQGHPHTHATLARPLEPRLRRELLALCQPGHDELHRAAVLDNQLARAYAAVVHDLLLQAQLAHDAIQAIGCHGQTVRHHPHGGEPYTVQLGNPSLLAELTGIQVIADFRRRDIAAGGQGAPLAPTFHQAFFADSEEARAVLNIGGIANLSLLMPNRPPSGFDTGPGNALLDGWAHQHLGRPLDEHGAWAAGGTVHKELLDLCLQDHYFRRLPPKSTGREHFHPDWLNARLAECGSRPSAQDVQATLAALTVESIARSLQRTPQIRRLLVCGGGVHNRCLLQGLQAALPNILIETTAQYGVDPDFMEAIGFAWLARQTMLGLPGNHPEVTGAKGLRILGGLYPA